MGGATTNNWHIDTALSNLSIAYMPTEIIADKIAPIIDVAKQSDRYFVFDKGDALRIDKTDRAPATQARRVEFGISSNGYYATNRELEYSIPYESIANADEGLALEQSGSEFLKGKLMLDYEDRVASLLTSSSTNLNSGSYVALSGTSQWSDYANSDPFTNIWNGKTFVRGNTGYNPNVLIIGGSVWEKLVNHPDILDRMKYTSVPTEASAKARLADLFNVEKVLIGNAVKNTGSEGLADSFTDVWGKNVVLGYVPQRAGLRTPSMMYSFRWKNPIFGLPMTVETRDDDDIKARRLRCGYYQDEKVTGADLGYVLNSVIA